MEATSELTLEARTAVIRRFNERVDQAMVERAPTKAWVRQALRRGGAGRCPVRLKRLSLDVILRYGDALADLFCEYPDDAVGAPAYEAGVGYQPKDRRHPIDTVQVLTEDAQWTDEWGTEWRHSAGGMGAITVSHPLHDWSQLDAYLAEQMPDPLAADRLDGAVPALQMHGQTKYVIGMTHLALFERLHCLRGMQQTFEDFHLFPAEVDRLLGALTDYLLEIIGAWGRLGEDGSLRPDAFFLTDDWGTQASLMISPRMWRKFFAARYRRICDEAHRWHMDVVFHSCGNVSQIIGDLIDAGIDVLDPVQPEAMDIALVAREFGGKVAFCGGISDQQIAVLTPAQVKDHVRRTVDTLGRAFGNAYLVGPSNSLPPEVPPENLQALFEACHNQ
jgi:uroporphyrinogen decarboxylase